MGFASLEGRRFRRCLWKAVIAAGVVTLAAPAQSASNSGCSSINKGLLNLKVAPSGAITRNVQLSDGDTLTVTFRAGGGRTGSVTLLTDGRTERLLLAGSHGTSASYTAERSGELALRLATEGGTGNFSAVCVPSAQAGLRPADAVAAKAWGGVPDLSTIGSDVSLEPNPFSNSPPSAANREPSDRGCTKIERSCQGAHSIGGVAQGAEFGRHPIE